MSDEQSLPIELDVQEVKKLQDEHADFLFVDCREQNEFDLVKIEGTTLIPMNETPNRLEELEPYRDKRIVVHCHHGGRSMKVTEYLRQQGFSGAQNMKGGIDVWSLEIDTSLTRY